MSSTQVIARNIRVIEPIYVSAMLDELRFFDVMDRLTSLFQSGLLPVMNTSGEKLYKYWKHRSQRFSVHERQQLYSRVLGLGGSADAPANREFQELWLRFVSAVSSGAGMSVRPAGRDLAANLSLHGFGFTHFAARDLQSQIRLIASILSAADVRSAYGARDMWQVIEKVAALELGGAVNTVRYRTMSESGTTIISWLAGNARELARESNRPIIRPQRDRRLIDACQKWLSVASTRS